MTDVDELENRIDFAEMDIELKFDEIENKIKKIKSDMNIWRIFSKYTIPYSYKEEMYLIQIKLRSIEYGKYLDKYLKESKTKSDIPVLYDLEDTKNMEKIVFKNSTNLKNSKIFSEIGKNLYWDIKPILYYYSISYLFSSFIGFFFNFKNLKGHHGLKISNVGDDPYEINVNVQKSGLFQRIVKSFSYIFDYSIFTDYFIKPKSKLCDTEDFIVFKNPSYFSIENPSFSIGELIEQLNKKNIRKFYDEINSKYDYSAFYSKNNFIDNSIMLKDYILIFVACNLARYNHYIWNNVYEGKTTDIFLHFQNAINNFNENVIYLSDRFKNYDKLIRYF